MLTALAFALFVVVAVLIAMRVLRHPAAPRPSDMNVPTPVELASFGVRAFSAIAAIAIVLAALFFLSAMRDPWLIGLVTGIVLLVTSEFVVRKYALPANAMAGAGLATLYASLYALGKGVPAWLWVAIGAMVVVTALTIWLSLRRESVFVPLLGITAAFLTPAILGFDEEGVLLFSFLLLLNVAAAWLAIARGWAVLIAISVPLTVLYEWAWVLRNLTSSRLPITALMFALIAIAGASPLWVAPRGDHPALFRRCAAAAALLPLLFAFYMAIVPNYALQYNVLFAFLFVIALGLASVVWRGAPSYLHKAGGIATLFTFFLWFSHWFTQSYDHSQWPVAHVSGLVLSLVIWIGLFVLLYLIGTPLYAGLLFFAFLGLAIRQPQDATTMIVAMLLILAFVVLVLKESAPIIAAIAAAFASLALIALHPLPILWPLFPAHALQPPPSWLLLLFAHAIVFAALFLVARSVAPASSRPDLGLPARDDDEAAWKAAIRPAGSRRYEGGEWLPVLAVPFYAAMVATTASAAPGPLAQIFVALVPYALFIALAFVARDGFAAYVAVALASLVFLLSAWAALDGTALIAYIGVVPLLQAAALGYLTWRTFNIEPREPRLTLLAATTLAFLSAAIPMLLPHIWTVMVWSILVAALMYVFTRLPHPAFVVWAVGLATVIFLRLGFEADLDRSRTAFIVVGFATFAAAWFSPTSTLRVVFSLFGLTELLFRINIEIANHYKTTGGAINLDLLRERPDAAYTIVWAIVATSLLFIGVFFDWPTSRGARIGATSLLTLAILKCFLHDVRYLHGDYRVASFLVVGLALVIAGALLQRFVNRAPQLAET